MSIKLRRSFVAVGGLVLALCTVRASAGAGAAFTIEVIAPADAKAGAQATAQVVLRPAEGYKVNVDFPIALELTAPDGVVLAQAKLGAADARRLDEHEARFEVRFTANAAGTSKLGAVLKFAVCSASTCDPKRERFVVEVRVQ